MKTLIMKTRMFCLLACLALAACAGAGGHIREADYPGKIKLACVGDSITYGAAIDDREHNSYPAQLAVMLGEKWDVRNFGKNSATLTKKGDRPYWDQREYNDAITFTPDVVVIKLGTNDTKPRNWVHKDEFVADYVSLVECFKGLESHPRVYICRPVPAFPENWGIDDVRIKEEIPMLDEVAAKTGAQVIDLHTALESHGDLFADKIHPNAEGAGIIAATVQESLTGKKAEK